MQNQEEFHFHNFNKNSVNGGEELPLIRQFLDGMVNLKEFQGLYVWLTGDLGDC